MSEDDEREARPGKFDDFLLGMEVWCWLIIPGIAIAIVVAILLVRSA